MNHTKNELVGTWKASRRRLILLSDGRCSFTCEPGWWMWIAGSLAGAPGVGGENVSGQWDLVDDRLTLEIQDEPLRIWTIAAFGMERMLVLDEANDKLEFVRS